MLVDRGVSGALKNRPELDRLLDQLPPGDVVVITKIDRLSRDLHQILDPAATIQEQGADIVSLAEREIATTTAAGKLVFAVFAIIAQFERDRLRERTKEGLARAKANGSRLGRPRALSDSAYGKLRKSVRQVGPIASSPTCLRSRVPPHVSTVATWKYHLVCGSIDRDLVFATWSINVVVITQLKTAIFRPNSCGTTCCRPAPIDPCCGADRRPVAAVGPSLQAAVHQAVATPTLSLARACVQRIQRLVGDRTWMTFSKPTQVFLPNHHTNHVKMASMRHVLCLRKRAKTFSNDTETSGQTTLNLMFRAYVSDGRYKRRSNALSQLNLPTISSLSGDFVFWSSPRVLMY